MKQRRPWFHRPRDPFEEGVALLRGGREPRKPEPEPEPAPPQLRGPAWTMLGMAWMAAAWREAARRVEEARLTPRKEI